jgi:ABC-type nitrate/sulfonate/bicarbonate transport system substrate-binding protein
MDRRTFFRMSGGAAGLAVFAPVLAACGSSKAKASAGSADTAAAAKAIKSMSYQLSWIKNFQFGGEYIADSKGYFKANGLDVTLLAGGPNVAMDAIVQSGKALVAQSSPDFTANAVAKGADLKIIGANYQKSPFCIISMPDKPITTPADLIGKKIGIQSTNEVAWAAFLKLANIDASKLTKVPVQYDITPLTSGEIDGFWGYSNDDVVHLQEKGIDAKVLLLADFGYKLMTGTYTVRTDSLADPAKRAAIVAFMKADIKGWQDAVADPSLTAKLTVDTYGKGNGLALADQEKSAAATNALMVTADTTQHGLMWMTPELIDESVATLAAAGVKADKSLFTTEILEEVFKDGPKVV